LQARADLHAAFSLRQKWQTPIRCRAAPLGSDNYLTRSLAGLQNVGQNSTITRINEKLASFEHSDAAEIDRRQDMLIKLACEVWRTAPIELN